ncbi:hypothetical protein ABB37_00024 [Leptomonas pyrrhocoris]|uniref:Mitochondrial carrier protein n=1 Tax=Leptomonas pyrrhocoris TaxID=157538 RepID=A0A0M9G9J2_LEPPY|nr:hypothetical protein ABB37_00024 [Leptomonas pyrrhocoris]KPA85620.1 hypothetical protein ABB37_00024 [Leptomonas pyrrhocoris]|eukprot:XP_015664059.1 hypothetical protein ABB37_00024 [Leptomonas pyrrhocoris]
MTSSSAAQRNLNASSSATSSSDGVQATQPTALQAPTAKQKEGFGYTAGPALVSGASQAILFNPIDRALYVRVKFRRWRFLDKRNFERPFQGFMNAAVYRTLVGASYMFWQDSMRIAIERLAPAPCQASASPQLNSMMIGLSAGSVNGLALNTLQAVKFRMWNTDERGITFMRTACNMYKEGGPAIFFRGCVTTMVRDSVFGVVYETTRRAAAWRLFFEQQVALLSFLFGSTPSTPPPLMHGEGEEEATAHGMTETAEAAQAAFHREKLGFAAFLSNLMAALTASMMSSPFNYVRSVVYGTPRGAIPLGYLPLLRSFYTQFFYIYRHGKSYTDRHGMPELRETEHRDSHQAAAASPTSSANSNATSSQRPSIGGQVHSAEGCSRGPSAAARRAQVTRRALSVSQMSAAVRNWADTHQHHPIAAWTWANSRLNIGWGSIRVGLGMAMGQSLFYLAQDFVREEKHRR